ncbi:MAG: hypothetical protein IT181_17675, partial [Acidobacteria bacterium]|nr:hypothetical protein [Acidobacteriota bacterium]
MHRRRRVMWWLAATAAAVVVLLVIAVAALHLGPARRYVLARLFEQLRAQQIDVTADDVRYNLAALSVSLDNVTVTSLRAPVLAPFATVARARVNLGMWALIRGRYEVDSARVSGVRIHYVVAPDGTTNLPTPPRPDLDEPAEVVDYLVRDTRLEDARVRYEDQRSGLDVTMPVTRLSIDGQLATSRHDVEVTAGPGTALVDGRTITIQEIAATADVGRDDVVLERLTVQAAGSQLEASGRLANFAEPAVDLTTRGDIDAAPALAAAGIDEAITGRIHLEATVSGALDALTLTASATSDGVAGRGLAPAALSLRGGSVQTEDVATIDTLDLTAPWGQVSARGRVARVAGETRLSARLSGVDAERLMSALDLPSRLATRVAGDLEVVMPGLDYTGATGRAAFTLVATSPTPRADVLPVSGVVRGTASGGDVVVQVERLDALAARVAGAVTLRGREVLGGTLRAGTADAGAVVRAAEAFLGERPGALSPTPVIGPVSIDARLGGTLAEPAVRAVLDAPALAVGGVRDVALSAVAEATRAAVVVP